MIEKAFALPTLGPVRYVYDPRHGSAFWANRDPHDIPWFSLQFANPVFFLAAVGLLLYGVWRRWLTSEETSFAAMLLLIPYCSRSYEMGMGSMGRFVVIVFPMHQVLALLMLRLSGPMRAAFLALSGFFLAAYSGLYAAGYAIF